MKFLAALFFLLTAVRGLALTDRDLDSIGRRVWQNECAGTRDGLTSWNAGEDFASLGIGHFIWYPAGARGPFEESFPQLLAFFKSLGGPTYERVPVPQWVENARHCPWNSRAEFQRDFRGEKLEGLRGFLAGTLHLQAQFLAQRMHEALPKMLASAPVAERENVRAQFARLAGGGAGTFALIDYVNFKGEGTKESERYHGEGWGLLQVLAGMRGTGAGAAREFGESASAVLARRVRNAPPERHEERWLPGWKSRVRGYGE